MPIDDIYDAIGTLDELKDCSHEVEIVTTYKQNNRIYARVEFVNAVSEHEIHLGAATVVDELVTPVVELRDFLESFQPENIDTSDEEEPDDDTAILRDFIGDLMDIMKTRPGASVPKSVLMGLIDRHT